MAILMVLVLGFAMLMLVITVASDRRLDAREASKIWVRVGGELGFVRDPESRSLELNRELGPIRIWISRKEPANRKHRSRMAVCIDGLGPVADFISLRAEEHGVFSNKPRAGEDVIVGDPNFDSNFLVKGPVPLLQAVLDESCRAQLLTVRQRGGATLQNGQLSYDMACGDEADAVWHGINRALFLARALRIKESEIPDRLAQNADSDDLPQLRIRNLEVLAKMPGCKDRAFALAKKLLHDPNPELRLQVALRLGAKEIDELLALADRERDKYARVALLAHLAKFAGQRLWPTIKEALRSRDAVVQRAAAEAASATGYTELAPRIARKIARHFATADSQTLVALTDALRALRDPTTEGVLVQLLAHESRDVQRAAALALGEFGSVAAVQPLLDCSAQLILAGDTKTAILQAVASIQARVGDVELGALSLADTGEHVGALSLADEDERDGALSLVDSPEEKKASE